MLEKAFRLDLKSEVFNIFSNRGSPSTPERPPRARLIIYYYFGSHLDYLDQPFRRFLTPDSGTLLSMALVGAHW